VVNRNLVMNSLVISFGVASLLGGQQATSTFSLGSLSHTGPSRSVRADRSYQTVLSF
jgi:hypothetical protein